MKSDFVIDKSDIINKEEFKVIESLITCPICCEVIYEPFQCENCENCFCKDCINNWSKKSKTCPFKCENAIYKESKLAKRILGILKVKCKNGCGEIINYSDIPDHYDIKCSKIDFKKKYFELKKKYDLLEKSFITNSSLKSSNNINNNSINIINNNENNNNIDRSNEEINSQLNFKSKYHIHKLCLVKTERLGWQCDICKRELSSEVKSYSCTLCDFDLCQDCVLEERKANGEKVGSGDVNINNYYMGGSIDNLLA